MLTLSEGIRDAMGGAVAAMAMSGMRQVTTEIGLVDEVPPEEVVDRNVPRLIERMSNEQRKVVVELAHWSYGAFGGVVFRLLPERIRQRRLAGAVYGVALWVLFEVVLAPLLGLKRPRDRGAGERAAFVADHAIYGLIVAGADQSA